MKVGKNMFKENIKKENIIKDYGFMLLLSLSFVHCSACSWVDASEIWENALKTKNIQIIKK